MGLGTHPIFESDFDCLTDDEFGIISRTVFGVPRAPTRRTKKEFQ